MKNLLRGRLAFCMLVLGIVMPSAAFAGADDINRYNHEQVFAGATDLPVSARLLYRQAHLAIHDGDKAGAITLLERATKLDPDYADPYFTLGRLKLTQFNLEGALLIVDGASATWHNFHSQSLAVLNAAAIIPYVLMLVALIIGLALTIKYLPFAAHKLQELMHKRLRASGARWASFLLLIVPFLILPGPITMLAYMTVMCWLFMRWRERFVLLVVLLPLIAAGLLGNQLSMLTPIANPNSLTSLVARANTSGADAGLQRSLEHTKVDGLEAERAMALGLLEQRGGNYLTAAEYFRNAISLRPNDSMGYVNLGNVYFLQAEYDKALEGYRKAEGLSPNDPACQYDLAQAFIKTLMMKESSKSYRRALAVGLDDAMAQYADDTREFIQVLPRVYTNAQLWQMAKIEGRAKSGFLDGLLFPIGRFGHNASAWLLLGAIALAFIMTFTIKVHKLSFQCANCGQLTCAACCSTEREMTICQACYDSIATVTSEKVIEALLRQKRQSGVVNRRRAARFATSVLPGIRDIYYGRVARGFFLATIFSLSLVMLVSRGFIMKDPSAHSIGMPLWKIILPAAGLAITFLMSIIGKQQMDFRTFRSNQMHIKKESSRVEAGSRVA